MAECQHEDFVAHVDVGRITAEEGGDPVTFEASLTITCAHCAARLGFRGMAAGMSYAFPTRSPDALEARLPLLSPAELELQGGLAGLKEDPPPPPLPGFGITVE